jgi:CheY-like chemotaxis protein
LPVLDSYQVAKRLRSSREATVLVIALTAYTRPEDNRLAFEDGFDVHLGKPADPSELVRFLGAT